MKTPQMSQAAAVRHFASLTHAGQPSSPFGSACLSGFPFMGFIIQLRLKMMALHPITVLLGALYEGLGGGWGWAVP